MRPDKDCCCLVHTWPNPNKVQIRIHNIREIDYKYGGGDKLRKGIYESMTALSTQDALRPCQDGAMAGQMRHRTRGQVMSHLLRR